MYRLKPPKSKLPRSAAGWHRAGDLATRAVNRHNFKPQVTAAAVCSAAEQLSSGQFVPISWRDGVLKLSCHTYEDLIAVRQREERLIETINETIGQKAVARILYAIT